MTRFARFIFGDVLRAAVLGLSLLVLPHVGNAAQGGNPPAEARPMTAEELQKLYGNKSWRWADGAGFMDTNKRRFTAIAGSGDKATWAEGRWTVSNAGRLCFVAKWHTKSGSSHKRTCFLHMVDGGTIYQRSEPSGKWYIFKHATPAVADEFGRLIREDLVSAELEKRKLTARSKKTKQ